MDTGFPPARSLCTIVTCGAMLRRAKRSEEHTSELLSQSNLVCRLLLEKKKKTTIPRLHFSTCRYSRDRGLVASIYDSQVYCRSRGLSVHTANDQQKPRSPRRRITRTTC